MRRLLHNRWAWAFLLWTLLIAVPVILLWPAASPSHVPCNYPGAVNQDSTLPPCAPDAVIGYGLVELVLVALWLAGAAIEVVAFVLWKLMYRVRLRRSAG